MGAKLSTRAVLASAIVVAMAGSAMATFDDQTGTVTRSATATWSVGDPRGTVVTVSPTVEQDNTGGPLTTTRTAVVSLTQHYCDTSGAYDLMVDVDMGATLTDPKYIEVFENGYQKARVSQPMTLLGTITWTPMGHNGTCAVATGPSQTDNYNAAGKLSADWQKDPASSPVTDQPTLDDFSWMRGALAKGRIEFRPLALKHYLLEETATASLSVHSLTTDGSDASTLFTIKP